MDLRLLAILAHPDDETLGLGGTLARYAAEGVETHVLTATRGERGRFFTDEDRPSDEEVGRVRETELRRACAALGVHELHLLDYVDGELDRAAPQEAIGRIVDVVRRVRPQVAVTFDPFGAYGHPDHIAISQFAAAALVEAADAAWRGSGHERAPHAVAKFYYFGENQAKWDAYQSAFRRLVSRVDGEERRAVPWPDWALTTWLDTRAQIDTVWRAVQSHETQMAIYKKLGELSPQQHEALWGSRGFYRVYSRVNGGRAREDDLFEGVREESAGNGAAPDA